MLTRIQLACTTFAPCTHDSTSESMRELPFSSSVHRPKVYDSCIKHIMLETSRLAGNAVFVRDSKSTQEGQSIFSVACIWNKHV